MNSHFLFCATLMVGCIFASSASAVVWDVFPKDVRTVGVVSVSDIIGAANLARATNELSKAGYAVKVMANVTGPKQASARVFSGFANKVKCPVYSGYPYGHVSDSYLLDFRMNMAITLDDTLVKAPGEPDRD